MRFLSKRQIVGHFTTVASSLDGLTPHLREGRDPLDGGKTADYARLMESGVEALFAPMAKTQPRAHAAVMGLRPELLVAEYLGKAASGMPLWLANAFVGSDDRYVRIEPYRRSDAISEWRPDSRLHFRYASLPPAIAEAYYSLSCGMEVLHELPGDPSISRVLPARIDLWGVRGDSLCGPGKKALATMKASLAAIADPATPPRADGLAWKSFACVLDSREQTAFNAAGDLERETIGTTGDLLFVQERSPSQRIFHVHDGDFANVRIVEDPVRLYDDYVAWVFFGGEGRFDFRAHSKPV